MTKLLALIAPNLAGIKEEIDTAYQQRATAKGWSFSSKLLSKSENTYDSIVSIITNDKPDACVIFGRDCKVDAARCESFDDVKEGNINRWIRKCPVSRVASSNATNEAEDIQIFLNKLNSPIKLRTHKQDYNFLVVNGWNRDFAPKAIPEDVTKYFTTKFLKHANAEEVSKIRFSNKDNFTTTWQNPDTNELYTSWQCYFDRPALVTFRVTSGRVSVYENGKRINSYDYESGECKYFITHGTLKLEKWADIRGVFEVTTIQEFPPTKLLFWNDHGKQNWVYAWNLDATWWHTEMPASELKWLSFIPFVGGCRVWGLNKSNTFSDIPNYNSESTPHTIILGYLTNGGILNDVIIPQLKEMWEELKEGKTITDIFKDKDAGGFSHSSIDDLNPDGVPDAFIKIRGDPLFSLSDIIIEEMPYNIEKVIYVPPEPDVTKEDWFQWLNGQTINTDKIPEWKEGMPYICLWIMHKDNVVYWKEYGIKGIFINPAPNPIQNIDQIIKLFAKEWSKASAKEAFDELPLGGNGGMKKEINLRLYLKKKEEGKWRVFGEAIVTDCDDELLSGVDVVLDEINSKPIIDNKFEFFDVEEGEHVIKAFKETYGICEAPNKPSSVEFNLP